MKDLGKILHRDAYSEAVEKLLREWFLEVIFEPLFCILRDAGVEWDHRKYQDIRYDELGRDNAASNAVTVALEAGKIWYDDGAFRGDFNAAISRELRGLGAHIVKSASGSAFHIELSALPFDLRTAIGQAEQKARDLQQTLQVVLGQMEQNIAAVPVLGLNYAQAVGRILTDLQGQFVKTAAGPLDIEIPMEMTPELKREIEERFTRNLDLSIRGFSAEMIPDLRRRVIENAAAGYRSSRLAQIIEAQYGVTKRKAAFLAEQETSLLVAKYREAEYRAIGCELYRWETSHDERVRPDHRALQGTVHAFSQPPITCRATGARNNPGEDFRCRCVAVALVNLGP